MVTVFLPSGKIFAAPATIGPQSLKTNYSEINYTNQAELGDFFWRISGQRLDFQDDRSLATSRVDRIIERVQAILDMHPDNFKVLINLYPKYEKGDIAAYQDSTRTIRVFADRITDGVFAHEVAHAVICSYFSVPPPEKVQEILCQYVDRHLWEDY